MLALKFATKMHVARINRLSTAALGTLESDGFCIHDQLEFGFVGIGNLDLD